MLTQSGATCSEVPGSLLCRRRGSLITRPPSLLPTDATQSAQDTIWDSYSTDPTTEIMRLTGFAYRQLQTAYRTQPVHNGRRQWTFVWLKSGLFQIPTPLVHHGFAEISNWVKSTTDDGFQASQQRHRQVYYRPDKKCAGT